MLKIVNKYKILLGISIFSSIVAIILSLVHQDNIPVAPWLLVTFIAAAIGFRGFKNLNGLSYPMTILAATCIAMFYPKYFLEVKGFQLISLITPLLQIIMFGMGTAMSLQDFVGVVKMPKGVIIGTLNHFTIMPVIGFSLATLFKFPPEIAAGVILIGSSPCGMASNVISYLARANLALSITLTTVSTLLAPLLTPLLMKMLGKQFIEINEYKMMWDIVKIVILPVIAGLLFNQFLKGRIKWVDKSMPLLSMSGIAVIIVIIVAAGRDNLMEVGLLLVFSCLLHNTLGYFFGYWSGRLFKMPEADCRTLAIEVGMQNGGLASGIAKEMGKVATVGLAPAIFGPLMNITGSLLASWWRNRGIKIS
jgi:bile acid:Na+ symporter, BASS family